MFGSAGTLGKARGSRGRVECWRGKGIHAALAVAQSVRDAEARTAANRLIAATNVRYLALANVIS